jgi:hypothetical protein
MSKNILQEKLYASNLSLLYTYSIQLTAKKSDSNCSGSPLNVVEGVGLGWGGMQQQQQRLYPTVFGNN